MKVDSDAARPFAYADPRSLSRAWFDALYAPRQQSRPLQPSTIAVTSEQPDARNGNPRVITATSVPDNAESAYQLGARSELNDGVADVAPMLSVPFGQRRSKPVDAQTEAEAAEAKTRLDVVCHTTDGTSLRMLLENTDGRVNVVAMCDARVATRMTDVLERARIALAARGVAITTRLITPR